MILTIGMIVKNEERYLRRCLEALAPILQQVDCELIIADTGSTDNTVEIAREYTDNVFFFEWCNDFSAARNAVLKRAKGAWYMTVDADEIFKDTEEIVSFFNSDDYKSYNSAAYIQRSANDKDLTDYSDLCVLRLTKVDDNTRYVNRIHEIIEPLRPPTKYFSAVVLHYGYVKEGNDKAIQEKAESYRRILLDELKKDPNNCKHYYDLSNAYFISDDLDKALEYSETGLKHAIMQKSNFLYPIYLNIILIYYSRKNYDSALDTIDKYFHSKDKPLAYDLELYCLLGHIYFETERYQPSIDAFEKYLKFLAEYQRGLHHGPEMAIYSENSTKVSAYRNAVIRMIRACVLSGDYKAADGYLRNYTADDWYLDPENMTLLIELEMTVMKKRSDYTHLPLLYNALEGNGLELLQEYIEYEFSDETCRQSILTALNDIDSETAYIQLIKLRHNYHGDGLTREAVASFIASIEAWSPLYADVLYFAVCFGCKPESIAEKIDLFELEDYLIPDRYLHFKDLPQQILKMSNAVPEPDDPVSSLWHTMLLYVILPFEQFQEEDITSLYYSYANAAHTYVRAVYTDDVPMDETVELLPKPIRLGCLFHTALYSEDTTQAIASIRHAVRLYPELAGTAKIILKEIQLKSRQQKSKNEDTEFSNYASIVKENIYSLIDSGKMNDALALMNSYEQLCPNDTDLPGIRIYFRENSGC